MSPASKNSLGSRDTLTVGGRSYEVYRLDALERRGIGHVGQLPFSLRVLLENLLRQEDGRFVRTADIEALAEWQPKAATRSEIAFMPARVLLQDFTGVPAVVDLAAMRDAMAPHGRRRQEDQSAAAGRAGDRPFRAGGPVRHERRVRIQRRAGIPAQRRALPVPALGTEGLSQFRVVPPDTGIVHQVNLEYLARVVFDGVSADGKPTAYPDTLVGTDSHTTMINGLGVLGWGVGGIEAEAAMLGQPLSMLIPDVVGFKLHGRLAEGATATDLVLTVTEMLRKKGVVGKFVEFFGTGLSRLSLPDRATIANMAPEYGATMGFFPVDAETLAYLRFTGRSAERIALVEAYTKEQGIFRTDQTPDPIYSDTLELDLATVEPTLAGPKRPQDRVPLRQAKASFAKAMEGTPQKHVAVKKNGDQFELSNGSVVIAAITSCTNTSNPSVMLGAGLLAKKAVERGLRSKPWVKTSLAPGSKVVTDYLNAAGLTPYLEQLNFHLVGYGCTTCIGNSGPLPEAIGAAVKDNSLVAVSVLSGNRNFEGRVHPAGEGQLPGFAAAGGGLRAGRAHGLRPGQRAAGQRQERQARLPARHLADAQGSRRHGALGGENRACSTRNTAKSSRAISAGAA